MSWFKKKKLEYGGCKDLPSPADVTPEAVIVIGLLAAITGGYGSNLVRIADEIAQDLRDTGFLEK